MRTKLGLGAAAVAVAFLSHLSGLPAGLAVASAAPLGAQAGLVAAYGGVATLAQYGRPQDDRPKSPGGSGDPGPGSKSSGGDGKKGAKGTGNWKSTGGSKHHGGGSGFGTGVGIGLGATIGGAIISGATQCAAQSDRCASRYGNGTSRYRRCMSDGGC